MKVVDPEPRKSWLTVKSKGKSSSNSVMWVAGKCWTKNRAQKGRTGKCWTTVDYKGKDAKRSSAFSAYIRAHIDYGITTDCIKLSGRYPVPKFNKVFASISTPSRPTVFPDFCLCMHSNISCTVMMYRTVG